MVASGEKSGLVISLISSNTGYIYNITKVIKLGYRENVYEKHSVALKKYCPQNSPLHSRSNSIYTK
jgi:hypothetical protein